MYIISGTASKNIAEKLSKELNEPLAKTVIKRFPDNECYIRILDDLKGEEVVIVQTTYPDPNIVELLLIQNAVSEAKAGEITVVIPYFGYGRQDKKFEMGEAISAKAIATHIGLNADKIMLVDPHKNHILDFFNVSAQECSPIYEMAQCLNKLDVSLILAPDKGALERAKHTSKLTGCEYDYLEKKRIDAKTIEIKTKNLETKGKNVAILDDIISTGGTMAKAISELKKQGAKDVTAACTHGLFTGDAINKIISAGCNKIISTNTIQNKFSIVDVAPCIAKSIRKNIIK